jgi:hypothetical protein
MDGLILAEHYTSQLLLQVDVRKYASGQYWFRIVDEKRESLAIKSIKK